MKTLSNIAREIAKDEEDYRKLMIVCNCVEHFMRTKINMLQPEIKLKSFGIFRIKSKYPKALYDAIKATMKKRGKPVWESNIPLNEYYGYKSNGYSHTPMFERSNRFKWLQQKATEQAQKEQELKDISEKEELSLQHILPTQEEIQKEEDDGIDRIF